MVFFEGAEKKIKIKLKESCPKLRLNVSPTWDEVVQSCGANILDKHSSEKFDSYILSESSLFVYDDTIILLTCGQTALYKTVPLILEKIRFEDIESFIYTRQELKFSDQSLHDFESEGKALSQFFPGKIYRLGPKESDHLYLFSYIAPKTTKVTQSFCESWDSLEPIDNEVFTEILMDSPSKNKMRPYLQKNLTAKDSYNFHQETKLSNIHPVEELQIVNSKFHQPKDYYQHEHFFSPFGHSLNGQVFNSYYTIHVTPEDNCSYASFETNYVDKFHFERINRIVEIYEPKKFILNFTTPINFPHPKEFIHTISNYTITESVDLLLFGQKKIHFYTFYKNS